ncbi:hypothetical protein EYC80_003755 [Monilinia laxa]|uniref:Uncharacterized protein n=1 Tax=Monilinia laxa TaxID=61186 RepID=A0A5N6KKX9_MONLA|nr:hypothetical protein EYC80_003755 [Monilinia laxa]
MGKNINRKGQAVQAPKLSAESQEDVDKQKDAFAEQNVQLAEQRFLTYQRQLVKQRQLAKKRRDSGVKAANKAIKNRALEFDFSVLPQHPNLIINKTKDNVQMSIDLNFFQSASAPSMESLLAAIPKYAEIITNLNVIVMIKAPKHHYNVATYNSRARNITKLIDVMNDFRIYQMELIASLDSHKHFEQLKLAAGAYGLNFHKWTLAYKIPGIDTKWQVRIGSSYERRLRGVYNAEFITQH